MDLIKAVQSAGLRGPQLTRSGTYRGGRSEVAYLLVCLSYDVDSESPKYICELRLRNLFTRSGATSFKISRHHELSSFVFLLGRERVYRL